MQIVVGDMKSLTFILNDIILHFKLHILNLHPNMDYETICIGSNICENIKRLTDTEPDIWTFQVTQFMHAFLSSQIAQDTAKNIGAIAKQNEIISRDISISTSNLHDTQYLQNVLRPAVEVEVDRLRCQLENIANSLKVNDHLEVSQISSIAYQFFKLLDIELKLIEASDTEWDKMSPYFVATESVGNRGQSTSVYDTDSSALDEDQCISSVASTPSPDEVPTLLADLLSPNWSIRQSSMSQLRQVHCQDLLFAGLTQNLYDTLIAQCFESNEKHTLEVFALLHDLLMAMEDLKQIVALINAVLRCLKQTSFAGCDKVWTMEDFLCDTNKNKANPVFNCLRFFYCILQRLPELWIYYSDSELSIFYQQIFHFLLLSPKYIDWKIERRDDLPLRPIYLLSISSGGGISNNWLSHWLVKTPNQQILFDVLKQTKFIDTILLDLWDWKPLRQKISKTHNKCKTCYYYALECLLTVVEFKPDKELSSMLNCKEINVEHINSCNVLFQNEIDPSKNNQNFIPKRTQDNTIPQRANARSIYYANIVEISLEILTIGYITDTSLFADKIWSMLKRMLQQVDTQFTTYTFVHHFWSCLKYSVMYNFHASDTIIYHKENNPDSSSSSYENWTPFNYTIQPAKLHQAIRMDPFEENKLQSLNCVQFRGVNIISEIIRNDQWMDMIFRNADSQSTSLATVTLGDCEITLKFLVNEICNPNIMDNYTSRLFLTALTNLANCQHSHIYVLERWKLLTILINKWKSKTNGLSCLENELFLLIKCWGISSSMGIYVISDTDMAVPVIKFIIQQWEDQQSTVHTGLICDKEIQHAILCFISHFAECAEVFFNSQVATNAFSAAIKLCTQNLDFSLALHSTHEECPSSMLSTMDTVRFLQTCLCTPFAYTCLLQDVKMDASLSVTKFLVSTFSAQVSCHNCLDFVVTEDLCVLGLQMLCRMTTSIQTIRLWMAQIHPYVTVLWEQTKIEENHGISACRVLEAQFISSLTSVTPHTKFPELWEFSLPLLIKLLGSTEVQVLHNNNWVQSVQEDKNLQAMFNHIRQTIFSPSTSDSIYESIWKFIEYVEGDYIFHSPDSISTKQHTTVAIFGFLIHSVICKVDSMSTLSNREIHLPNSNSYTRHTTQELEDFALMFRMYSSQCAVAGVEPSKTSFLALIKEFGSQGMDPFALSILIGLQSCNFLIFEIIKTLRITQTNSTITMFLWPSQMVHATPSPLLRVAFIIEHILQQIDPQVLDLLTQCQASVSIIILRWEHQCFWKYMRIDNILKCILLSYVSGMEFNIYLVVTLLKHLKAQMVEIVAPRNCTSKTRYIRLMEIDLTTFQLANHHTTFTSLEQRFHEFVQNKLSIL